MNPILNLISIFRAKPREGGTDGGCLQASIELLLFLHILPWACAVKLYVVKEDLYTI